MSTLHGNGLYRPSLLLLLKEPLFLLQQPLLRKEKFSSSLEQRVGHGHIEWLSWCL